MNEHAENQATMQPYAEFKKPSEGGSRIGKILLPAGEVPTPVFMPVGTQGTVKGVLPRDLREVVKSPIVLGNTYHLNLRPGMKTVERAGGLGKFMNWDGPILTDSGGFQVFSLSKLRITNDEGVRFRSHLDGKEVFLGPKEAMTIQECLKSDVAMCLDECPPASACEEEITRAVRRTTSWARKCKNFWMKSSAPKEGRKLFGIVQGGRFKELRRLSSEQLMDLDLSGYAVGGVSVGESEEEMLEQTSWTTEILPQDKPRYVMGVGTPIQLLRMIDLGVDMFDCVLPSRAARHGTAYTSRGKLNIRNERFKEDYSPLDEETDCYVSKEFSKSYIRHLFVSNETLGGTLLTLHNLRFFVQLMECAREQIKGGTFSKWSSQWIDDYESEE